MSISRILVAVALLSLTAADGLAGAPPPVPDHLQCLKIKDSIAKQAYTVDLDAVDLSITDSTGCTVKTGAKYLCFDVFKENEAPAVPSPSFVGEAAQKYLCYKTKCPTSPSVVATISDQFGSHPVASKTTGLVCAPAATPPSCTNGIEDGTETDIDCGGTCPDCGEFDGCNFDTDCASNFCYANTCLTPTCDDGIWNAAETATDCGGGTCPACGNGLLCSVASDCQSGVCTGTCQAPTCSDAVQNGDESDNDCGGTCPDCPDLSSCFMNSDCVSNFCSSGICIP